MVSKVMDIGHFGVVAQKICHEPGVSVRFFRTDAVWLNPPRSRMRSRRNVVAGFQTIVSYTIAAPVAVNMVVRSDTAQSLGAPGPGALRGWDAVSFNLKETKPDRPAPQGLEIPKNFICPLRRSSP